MEGFYQKASPPKILLSAQRPLPRRAFTCAHEIGHHWFGHGSTVDQLQQEDREPSDVPEEILADGFAGFVLMPPLGIRSAFARRKWSPATATPLQLLTVATEFGVGYKTLTAHLTYSLKLMSVGQRAQADKTKPLQIREQLLGANDLVGMAVLDTKSQNRNVDLEVGYGLVVPYGTSVVGSSLAHLVDHSGVSVYRANARGVAMVHLPAGPIAVRTAPYQFSGLAQYRHLEDPDA